mgnify:CR=1 FL=1
MTLHGGKVNLHQKSAVFWSCVHQLQIVNIVDCPDSFDHEKRVLDQTFCKMVVSDYEVMMHVNCIVHNCII